MSDPYDLPLPPERLSADALLCILCLASVPFLVAGILLCITPHGLECIDAIADGAPRIAQEVRRLFR